MSYEGCYCVPARLRGTAASLRPVSASGRALSLGHWCRCSRLCIEATWKVFCNQDTSFLLMEGPQTSLRTWWCGNKRHYQLEVGLDWGSRIRRAWRGNQRQSHVVKRPPGESAEQEFSKGWTCGSEFLMKATVQVSGKPQGCGYWLGHFAVFKSCFSHLIF